MQSKSIRVILASPVNKKWKVFTWLFIFPAFLFVPVKGMGQEIKEPGNGENGLQQMLMQTDGKKIMLLPAWPKNWDVDFKLNAPYNTTVQGKVENGKLMNLIVIPASRMEDVVDMTK